MAKTDATKKLERLLQQHFNARSNFYVFECTIGWYGSEVVDAIMYDTDRLVYCYEIKQSVSDFRSNNKVTFIGNKNYYVMPATLYDKVKDEIPYDIGVYIAYDHMEQEERDIVSEHRKEIKGVFVEGFKQLSCIKQSRKRDLKADKEVILSSMLRCMQRDRMRSGKITSYDFDWNPWEDETIENPKKVAFVN